MAIRYVFWIFNSSLQLFKPVLFSLSYKSASFPAQQLLNHHPWHLQVWEWGGVGAWKTLVRVMLAVWQVFESRKCALCLWKGEAIAQVLRVTDAKSKAPKSRGSPHTALRHLSASISTSYSGHAYLGGFFHLYLMLRVCSGFSPPKQFNTWDGKAGEHGHV